MGGVLAGRQVRSVRLEGDYAVLGYANAQRIAVLNAERGKVLRVADERSAYLPLSKADRDPEAALKRLRSLLRSG